MASTAKEVFPVLRSPIISSRWPRPIGTKASTALIPVCIGSFTLWRSMIPGAGVSTGRVRLLSIRPKPSKGRPSGSTTRPNRPGPTGTSMILPRRRTKSPSWIFSYLPKMIIPTSLDSRFCTMPIEPLANSTISPDMTFSNPITRAIPSPIKVTVPISSKLSCDLKRRICWRKRSSKRSVIYDSSPCNQPFSKKARISLNFFCPVTS